MELVDEYIALLDEPKKEWVTSMVNFMREVFPEVKETLSNKIPTYNGDGYFIAFAAQKNYFTFRTDDMRVLSLMNNWYHRHLWVKATPKLNTITKVQFNI